MLSILRISILALAAWAGSATAQEPTLTIFAAASLKNALDDVNAAFTSSTRIKVVASHAASSALIRQIEQGAPADVFISADLEWMNYGAQKKLINEPSRFNLLGNKLVLIAPADSKAAPVAIAAGFDLAKLAGDGRIAAGDVKAVPAGQYAKAALEKLGLWASVEPKLAMTENVRVALTLVARGEAPLGIVYETDAKAEPKVKVIGTFPDGSHPAIVYPAAATKDAKPEAARYLAYLKGGTAQVLLQRHGFTYLVKAGP